MLIYRIEDCIGKGPYTYGTSQWTSEVHCPETGRPGPHNGGGALQKFFTQKDAWEKTPDYIFGFQNISLLTKWFTFQELSNLGKLGYVVSVYRSRSVIKSDKQCVFKNGVLEKRIEMTEFLNMVSLYYYPVHFMCLFVTAYIMTRLIVGTAIF